MAQGERGLTTQPPGPLRWKGEPTPQSCPLTSLYTVVGTHTGHTQKDVKKRKILQGLNVRAPSTYQTPENTGKLGTGVGRGFSGTVTLKPQAMEEKNKNRQNHIRL